MPRHQIPSRLLEKTLTGVISAQADYRDVVHDKQKPSVPSSQQTDMLDIEACIDQPELAPLGLHVVKGEKATKKRQAKRQQLHRYLLNDDEVTPGKVAIRDLTIDEGSTSHLKLGTAKESGSTVMLRRRRINTSELEYHLATITKTTPLSSSFFSSAADKSEDRNTSSSSGSIVKELDVSRNQIASLPTNITMLASHLRVLNLSNNILTTFPPELYAFSNLEVLMLSQNKISGPVPEELPLKIPNLTVLRLSANLITSLPLTMGNWRKMKRLILGSVFGGNLIQAIPEDCLSTMQLEELDLSHNQLKSLPTDFTYNQNNLLHLNLSDNQLETLPRSIGQITNLRSLSISKNHLTTLPIDLVNLKNLDILDVSENLLCILPGDILEFMRKTTLLITGNPLSRPGNCDLRATETAPDNSYMEIIRKMSQRAIATRTNVLEYEQCGPNGMGCENSNSYFPSSPILQPHHLDDDAAIDHELSFHARQLNIDGSRPSTPVNGMSSSEANVSELVGVSRSSILSLPMMASSSSSSSLSSELSSDVDMQTSSPPVSTPDHIDTSSYMSVSMTDSTPGTPVTYEEAPRLVNSLRELASRSIFAHNIPIRLEDIPELVHSYVEPGAARPCAHCGKPYIKEWMSSVQVKSFRGHPAVVRRVRFCSERCWSTCAKDNEVSQSGQHKTSRITDTVVCMNGLPSTAACTMPSI
ncbi:hypothetical protein INT43_003857 [Umbelopsis isabellina]|uniref:L domain-like protein n=1 Tax=Mortierella isabellina TaxID=91625 RepID=A0A8H7PUD3_MORIS|nr:hypothetical protein INT43_003857 [Umbelopsis isabellina]